MTTLSSAASSTHAPPRKLVITMTISITLPMSSFSTSIQAITAPSSTFSVGSGVFGFVKALWGHPLAVWPSFRRTLHFGDALIVTSASPTSPSAPPLWTPPTPPPHWGGAYGGRPCFFPLVSQVFTAAVHLHRRPALLLVRVPLLFALYSSLGLEPPAVHEGAGRGGGGSA